MKVAEKAKKSKKRAALGAVERRTCKWCNVTFTNRGNLIQHTKFVHSNFGDHLDVTPESFSNIKCAACEIYFRDHQSIKFHIRKNHFNLVAKIPFCEEKKVNQIWYEKVQNSNCIVEMKKLSQNTIVMRKIPPNATIKVCTESKTVNLSELYPLQKNRSQKAKCEVCHKVYLKRVMAKHMDERHKLESDRKHKCNKCDRTFTRLYLFLRHVCEKKRRRRRVVDLTRIP